MEQEIAAFVSIWKTLVIYYQLQYRGLQLLRKIGSLSKSF